MKLHKFVSLMLIILFLSGCSNNTKHNEHTHSPLYYFLSNQFNGSEYTPVFLNSGYYSTGQACHYILINNILGNEIDKTDLDLFKEEAIKSGYLDLYSTVEVFLDNKILNQNEIKNLKNKLEDFVNNNIVVTDENWIDLYYCALNLNKINKFDARDIANKLKEYSSNVENITEKIKIIYCYCSLMAAIDNFDFRNESDIKILLKKIYAEENMQHDLNLSYVYYSLLKLMDLSDSEYSNKVFLDSLEKKGLYDTYDNLNLDRLYLKLAILNQVKPQIIENHKKYILEFLDAFRDKKAKALFPILSYSEASEYDYYAYKLVMENFLCENGIKIDTKFESDRSKDYSHIDSMRGKLFKLIYDEFVSDGIKDEHRKELKNQILAKNKKELSDNYLALVVWNLIGQDLNKLFDKKDLFNEMKQNISAKNYSKVLEQADLLEMMGMDKKILYSHFKKIFDEIINQDKTIDEEIYLCYLLRYKLTGQKPNLSEINQKFDVKTSADGLLIVGNGCNTKYMDIKDYLYYYCLQNINIVSKYVR